MAAPSPSASASPPEESDWTDQVADLIVDVVDRVHDRTTAPLLQASRWLVYGTIALVVGGFLLILGIILTGRLLALLPLDIWVPYVVIGALLSLTGLWLWGKRGATP